MEDIHENTGAPAGAGPERDAPVSIPSILARWICYFAAAALVAMCLHITAEVFSRLFMRRSLPATIEIVSFYYMVIVTFLPLAYVQLKDEHIKVDILYVLLPGKLRAAVHLFSGLVTMAMLGVFGAAMVRVAWRKTQIGELVDTGFFDLPLGPARWLVPIGLAAMLLMLIAQLVAFVSGRAGTVAVQDPRVSDSEEI